jgi:hypothetical protein
MGFLKEYFTLPEYWTYVCIVYFIINAIVFRKEDGAIALSVCIITFAIILRFVIWTILHDDRCRGYL